MKSFIFCCAVGALFAVSAVSNGCRAAELPRAQGNQVVYCEQYAEAEYRAAEARGDDFADAAFEGAEEECEVQWLAVTGSLDGLMRADIALHVWEAKQCFETDCQPGAR